MSIELETATDFAPFIAPRDNVVTPFTWWERGGLDIDESSDGVDFLDWYFECDPVTGIVTVEVPGVITPAVAHTISPLPVEVTGSFDLGMQPIVAWRDVNDNAFIRARDTTTFEYVVTQLPAGSKNLKLAFDDVRAAQYALEVTDVVLAYTRDNALYARLFSEDFAVETELAPAGFPSLYQIGMNTDFRFQFQRTQELVEDAAQLSYLRVDNRAGKVIGFDAAGDAALYDEPTLSVVGAEGDTVSITKLGADHTYFLRADDGSWVNTQADVTVEYRRNALDLRSSLTLRYEIDTYGNITRTPIASAGESSIRLVESGVGTPVYTATLYLSETGQGVTFSLLSVSGTPVTGTFEPVWNANGDFPGGALVPTGAIRFTDYGTWVVLSGDSGEPFTARSRSTRLRWGAGSIPAGSRPALARSAACTVVRNEVTLAGQALVGTDGSVEFWPLDASGANVVRGAFTLAGGVNQTKGLPATWQMIYVKPVFRFRVTEDGDPRITESGDIRRL
jgi:hypothetical protein